MEDNRSNIREIMVAINKIDGLYYLVLHKYGMKYSAFALFYMLEDGKQHSQKQICEDMGIPRTTLNTIVKECVKAGHVILTPIGNREKAISLTEKGHIYADGILKIFSKAEDDAMKKTIENFSDEFVGAFKNFAENLNRNLTQHIDGKENQ